MSVLNLKLATFNLHGFNQGCSYLDELCSKYDIVFVQEHWLAPFDLCKLINLCPDMLCYASSAMESIISKSILAGRPFGGLAIFVHSKFSSISKLI